MAMTPDQFRATLDRLGLTSGAAARLLGVEYRSVRRYMDGTREVPNAIVRLLALLEHQPKNIRAFLHDFP